MAEEKKAYKKAKEREKSSLDKRKQDPDWKVSSVYCFSDFCNGDSTFRVNFATVFRVYKLSVLHIWM